VPTNIRANLINGHDGGGFLVPYDVKLLKVNDVARCMDSMKIMMARCMTIIHY